MRLPNKKKKASGKAVEKEMSHHQHTKKLLTGNLKFKKKKKIVEGSIKMHKSVKSSNEIREAKHRRVAPVMLLCHDNTRHGASFVLAYHFEKYHVGYEQEIKQGNLNKKLYIKHFKRNLFTIIIFISS